MIRIVKEMKAGSIVFFRPYSYRAMRQVIDADPAFRVLVDLEDWIRLPGLASLLRKNAPMALTEQRPSKLDSGTPGRGKIVGVYHICKRARGRRYVRESEPCHRDGF